MKKLLPLLLLSLIINLNSYSQEVSCNDLLTFIKSEGFHKASLSSYTLNSSWLQKVTAYSYDYKVYVVAEIKKDQYSYQTNTYIFCGIPSQNWTNFKNGGFYNSSTFGERFHKYIIDYQCNCY
jgi:hypothetical protein